MSAPLDFKNSRAASEDGASNAGYPSKASSAPLSARGSPRPGSFSPTMAGLPEERPEDLAPSRKELAQQQQAGEDEHRQLLHNHARMHQEAHATLKHMFKQAHGDDNILLHFIEFIARTEPHWKNFWSRFRSDGTMTR